MLVRAMTEFLIGFFVMNAMPHFMVWVFRGRLLSLFGVSPRANLAYSLLNFGACLTLVIATRGAEALVEDRMLLGVLFILVTYYATGRFFHRRYNGG